MSLVMDSRGMDEPKPDAEKNIAVQLLKLVAEPELAQDCEDQLRAGGYGYGHLKKALFEACWSYFEPMRQKREELAKNIDFVQEVLSKGAERARSVASAVNNRAKNACGLD